MTLDPEDPRLDPDTREILRRRAAFIRKSLLGAGLALASLSACGAEACLSPLSSPPAVDTSDSSDASGDIVDDTPQICLSPREPDTVDTVGDVPDDTPQVCLSQPLDVIGDAADDTPQVCLSPREPDVVDTLGDVPDDAPQICLSPPAPDVIDDVPDAPQICLSPPAPDAGKPG
jgi:hypothetical protein